MSCIIEPGSVKHIDHLYQPSDDFLNATHETIKLFRDMFNGGVEWKWTHKIDDRTSLKIRKLNGVYGVGYKGNSPFKTTQEEIDGYSNVSLVHPLTSLLHYASSIIPEFEDNVEYQVGILWYATNNYYAIKNINPPYDKHSLENIDKFVCPVIIAPNITTYIPNPKYLSHMRLAISVASRSDLDSKGNRLNITQDIDYAAMNRDFLVFVVNNSVNLPIFSNKTKALFTSEMEHLKTLFNYRQSFLDRKDYILKLNTTIREYINYCIKNSLQTNLWGYGSFLSKKHVEDVLSVKMDKTKTAKKAAYSDFINFISEHLDEVQNMFDMSASLRNISNMILDELSTVRCADLEAVGINEGFVVTKKFENKLVAFKIVPTDFSKRNFDVHDNRSVL